MNECIYKKSLRFFTENKLNRDVINVGIKSNIKVNNQHIVSDTYNKNMNQAEDITKIPENSKLLEDIISSRNSLHPDRVLLPKGSILSKDLIDTLNNEWSISKVKIDYDNKDNSTSRICHGLLEKTEVPSTKFPLFYDSNSFNQLIEELGNNEKMGKEIAHNCTLNFKRTLESGCYKNALVGLANIVNLSKTVDQIKSGEALTKDHFNIFKNNFNRILTNKFYNSLMSKYPFVLSQVEVARQIQGDFTLEHMYNVAKWTFLIASSMQLTNNTVSESNDLISTALLHDIGKFYPSIQQVLYKKEGFTMADKIELSNHVAYGIELLEPYNDVLSQNVFLGLSQHHEKYNGTGYPNKLANAEISSVGGLISVADKFDAIFFNRPYRDSSFGQAQAVNILIKEIYGDSRYFYQHATNMKYSGKDPYIKPLLHILNLTGLYSYVPRDSAGRPSADAGTVGYN